MPTSTPRIFYCCLLILGVILFACKSDAPVSAEDTIALGEIKNYATGNAAAVASFHEGMLLLHSFEYVDAAEKFAMAQQLDSTCVLAYWGEAMSHNHPLWREQKTEEALAILDRLAPSVEERKSLATTPLEKELLEASEILFAGATDKKERDGLYSDYLAELHQKYPDNHEVGSLYALSLLGAVKAGRDYEAYEMGAKVAESIIAENPNHPGALHYLIHSYDDPEHAAKALFAANSYAQVAPDASHALHMPSHIYVAMGMWDEVVSSNVASWTASVKRKESRDLENDELGYHAFLWLSYAYLQRGEFDHAKKCVADMQRFCTEDATQRAKWHLMFMKAAYVTETGRWEDPLLQDTFTYDHNLVLRATDQYMLALQDLRKGDFRSVENRIKEIKADRLSSSKEAEASTAVMCAGRYDRRPTTPTEVKKAHILELELAAQLASAKGKSVMAEDLFKQAVALEDQTSFQFGPPSIVQPSSELYAHWLMDQERYKDAASQYALVLERAPGRKIAADGLAKANSAGS